MCVEWRVEWSGVEWSGVEWSGVEWSAVVEWRVSAPAPPAFGYHAGPVAGWPGQNSTQHQTSGNGQAAGQASQPSGPCRSPGQSRSALQTRRSCWLPAFRRVVVLLQAYGGITADQAALLGAAQPWAHRVQHSRSYVRPSGVLLQLYFGVFKGRYVLHGWARRDCAAAAGRQRAGSGRSGMRCAPPHAAARCLARPAAHLHQRFELFELHRAVSLQSQGSPKAATAIIELRIEISKRQLSRWV